MRNPTLATLLLQLVPAVVAHPFASPSNDQCKTERYVVDAGQSLQLHKVVQAEIEPSCQLYEKPAWSSCNAWRQVTWPAGRTHALLTVEERNLLAAAGTVVKWLPVVSASVYILKAAKCAYEYYASGKKDLVAKHCMESNAMMLLFFGKAAYDTVNEAVTAGKAAAAAAKLAGGVKAGAVKAPRRLEGSAPATMLRHLISGEPVWGIDIINANSTHPIHATHDNRFEWMTEMPAVKMWSEFRDDTQRYRIHSLINWAGGAPQLPNSTTTTEDLSTQEPTGMYYGYDLYDAPQSTPTVGVNSTKEADDAFLRAGLLMLEDLREKQVPEMCVCQQGKGNWQISGVLKYIWANGTVDDHQECWSGNCIKAA